MNKQKSNEKKRIKILNKYLTGLIDERVNGEGAMAVDTICFFK